MLVLLPLNLLTADFVTPVATSYSCIPSYYLLLLPPKLLPPAIATQVATS